MQADTREEWLNKLVGRLRPVFAKAGSEVPEKVRVTCGFPAVESLSRRIGECWSDVCSADGHFEIMISPVLSDPMRVAGVLAHELTHASVGLKAGHKGPFKRIALALGLEGAMTATTEGASFKLMAQPILDTLGPYPHAALDPRGLSTGPKKQTARLLKAVCPECGYTVRVTRKWIEIAVPICPVEHEEMGVKE